MKTTDEMSENNSITNARDAGNAPRISVVVPLFNKILFIEDTIQSIKAQTFLDFEVLIVDDGSTDGSNQAARDAIGNDHRFQLCFQPNAGVSAARNHGARLARGSLLAFLDADDKWDKGYLQSMWDLHMEYPAAKLYSSAYRVKRYGTTEENFFGLNSRIAVNYPFFSLAIKNGPAIWTSATVVDASTFARLGGFPVGMSVGEDILVWVKFLAEGDYVFLNKHLATYDMSDLNSTSKQVGVKSLHDRRQLIAFMERFNRDRLLIPSSYINAFREIQLSELSRGGFMLQAIHYYMENITRFPVRGIKYLLRGLKKGALEYE